MTESVATADFAALLEAKKDLESEIVEKGKDLFAVASKEIFEKYGDVVQEFGWNQYTPYFNDGEPCVFGAHEAYVLEKGLDPEEHEDLISDARWGEGTPKFSEYADGYPLSKVLYRDPEDGSLRKWSHADNPEEIPNPNYDPKYGDPYNAIHDLRNLLDDNTLLELFGDHAEIRVTADGVEVEECSHD